MKLFWVLIFMNNMQEPAKHTFIGHFDSYQTCRIEATELKNSSYYNYWGCVQLTQAEIDNLNKAKVIPK